MHSHPKLILLNGAAGVGKSTIAQRYLDDHPLALAVEGDELVSHMGHWAAHENIARKLTFELVKAMARTHLDAGHDVIMPHLLMDIAHARALEQIAEDTGARFIEIILATGRDDAIQRMFTRGTWSEPNSPPLTDADRPVIEDKYDHMVRTLPKRPHMRQVVSLPGQIDQTYRDFAAIVSTS